MKRFLLYLAIFIGVLVVAGFIAVKTIPQEKLIAAAMPEIDNLKITDAEIGEEEATMLVNVDVTSKMIPVFIDSLQYEMRLYNQTISKGHKKFEPGSKKGKVQNLSLPMTMNHNQTRDLVRRQVKEDEPVQVIMKAYADLPLVGKKQFDIDKQIDMVVPALPGMKLKDLQIKDFGLDNMGIGVTMEIDNPNEFDFYIRDLNYTLDVKDLKVSEGRLTKDQLIKARSVESLQLFENADLKKPLKNTFKILTGKTEYPYTMNTHMVMEPEGGVVGKVNISSVKTGSIDVKEQLKNVKETKKAKKKAAKEAKKNSD